MPGWHIIARQSVYRASSKKQDGFKQTCPSFALYLLITGCGGCPVKRREKGPSFTARSGPDQANRINAVLQEPSASPDNKLEVPKASRSALREVLGNQSEQKVTKSAHRKCAFKPEILIGAIKPKPRKWMVTQSNGATRGEKEQSISPGRANSNCPRLLVPSNSHSPVKFHQPNYSAGHPCPEQNNFLSLGSSFNRTYELLLRPEIVKWE